MANHVFTVRARDSNTMIIQEYNGAPKERQVLVLEAFRDNDWTEHFILETVDPPGLPDIKWNELYSKWGRFVPQHRKHGLVYYCNKPPPSVKKKIEEQAKAAREQRKQRSRAGGKATLTPMGRKLKAVEKKAATKKNPPAARKKAPAKQPKK